jgi:hypothetical protein
LVLLRVVSNELLGESPGGTRNDGLLRLDNCGPNTVYHVLAANSNASRIDKKIEFLVTKKRDPVEPLNIGSGTGGPDRTWWQAHGGESHATTAGTFDRPLNIPIGGIMSGEVVLEGQLEVDESIFRVRADELLSEENDNTGDSGGERKGRIHCVKERKRLSTGDRYRKRRGE